MPDCPDCGNVLALTEIGAICPTCKRQFTPMQLSTLPGFDADVIREHIELFLILLSAGVLQGGLNTVEVIEDGLIVEHKGSDY